MGNMITSNVQDNEILKAVDINDSFDAQITNIAKTLQCLLENENDFIISKDNLVTQHSDGDQDWTINLAPVFGISSYNGMPILETEQSIAAASVTAASTFDRYDTVEIRGVYKNSNIEQRAFVDFETNDKSISSVYTKRELKIEVQVLKNTIASVSAPAHTEGWVKIAEIFVPSTATKIADCTIYNITSDVAGLENENWTNEKTATYNVHYISDLNEKFRVEHTVSGTHKNKIIHKAQMDYGTGDNQVNSSQIPIGDSVTVSKSGIPATTSVIECIKTIADKINDLYNDYLAAGKYAFSREVVIYGNDSATYPESSKLKFGIQADNSVYVKIGTSEILKITKDGKISAKSDYVPTEDADLVTKKVTDTITTNLSTLKTRVDNLEETSDKTIYSNNTLSRYSVSTLSVLVASTINLTLSGVQRIDNIDCSVGSCVLVKNQTDSKENGLYKVSNDTWSRMDNFIKPSQIKYLLFNIQNGSINKGKLFYCPKENFINSDAFGSDNISFSEYSGSINALANKSAVRDSSGHVKASSSTSSDDCVIRNELDSKDGDLTKKLLDFVYPVGSLYWSSKNVDPSTLFGGTWTQIKDTLIMAAGTTFTPDLTKFKNQAGNSTVTLSEDNLPNHTHTMNHSHSGCSFSGTVAQHKHFFTPEGTVSSHNHGYIPEGSISIDENPTFKGETVTTGGMSENNSGWFEIPGAHSTNTIYDKSGNISAEKRVTKYRGLEDLTQDFVWRVGLNVAHTHDVKAAGSISGGSYSFSGSSNLKTDDTAPSFSGSRKETENSESSVTCSVSGSTSQYTGNTGSTGKGTAIDIMNPYLVRYCWERTA